MENYIDIQYITNLVNFGYANDVKILQLETIKTKILLLLSCNDIVTYDTKSTRKATGNMSFARLYDSSNRNRN